MNATDHSMIADRLNRLVKLAMDTGEAASVEEAEKLFAGYQLSCRSIRCVAHLKRSCLKRES